MLFWQKKSQLFFLSILLLAAFFVVEIRKVEAAFDPAVTYSKTSNGQLSADEWNNLQNDFVRTWGSTTAVGGIGIGVAPQGTDINGLVASSTIKTNTSFLGALNASYITPGAFNSVAGTGGNFSFPANLGIGATPVNAGLHLSGADTYSAMFRLVNSSASGGQYFMGVTNSAWDAGGNKLVFGAGTPSSANIKMVLAANGNVGIGTTAPGAKLDVLQNMSSYSSAFTSPHLKLRAGNAVNDTGFVGITYDASTSANYGWSSGSLRGASAGLSSFIWKYHNNSAAGVEYMRINSSGNVGIGTINPEKKLHVGGDIQANKLLVTGSSSGENAGVVIRGDRANLLFDTVGVTGGVAFNLITAQVTNTDPLTSKWGTVGLYGSANVGGDPSVYYMYFDSRPDGTYNKATLKIDPDNKVGVGLASTIRPNNTLSVNGSVDISGNVGIGKTNPSYKLDVVGEANFGGNQIHGVSAPATGTDAVNRSYVDSNFAPIGGGASLWATSSAGIYNVGLGKVGIGTAAPTGRLGIYTSASTAVETNAIAFNAGGSELGSIRSYNAGGYIQDMRFYVSNGTSTPALFNALTIKGTGNVGIGNTAPGYKLDVLGEANFNGNQIHGVAAPVQGTDAANKSYVDSSITPPATTTAGIQAGFWTTGAGGSIYNNNSSGLVGIGTTNPGSKLTVSGADNKDTGPILNLSGSSVNQLESGRVRFTETTVAAAPFYQGAFFHYDGSANTFNIGVHETADALQASDINSIRITRSNGSVNIGNGALFTQYNGNVGVGINNPDYPLTIKYSANGQIGLRRSDGNTVGLLGVDSSNVFNIQSTSGSGNIAIKQNVGGSGQLTTLFLKGSNGNVGIGTTAPTQKLHVTGDASFLVGTSSPSQVHDVAAPTQGTDVANRNYVDTNFAPIAIVGSASLWATSSAGTYNVGLGNVGVGTTAPSQKLDVQGNIALAANILGGGKSYGYAAGANSATLQMYSAATGNTTLNNAGYNIDLQTATTSRLYINNSGNIGIGTTAPGNRLTISNGVTNVFTKIDANSIKFTRASDGADRGLINFDGVSTLTLDSNAANGVIRFLTDGRPAMTVFNNQNVGIATSAPAYKLDLAGDLNLNTYQIHGLGAPTTGTDAVNRNYVDTNFAPIAIVGSASLWATSSAGTYNVGLGNVGVGITNPATKLHVSGDFTLSGASKYIQEYVSPWMSINAFGASTDTAYLNFGSLSDFGHLHLEVEITGWANSTLAYGSLVKHYDIRPRNISGSWSLEGVQSRIVQDSGYVSSTVQLGEIEANGGAFRLPIKKVTGAEKYVVRFRATSWSAGVINNLSPSITQPSSVSAGTREYTKISNRLGVGLAQGVQPVANFHVEGNSYFNGNVGIGTTTPGYKLDLAGDLNSNTYQIHGLGAPTTGTDAVNRNYVDTLISDSVSATDFWKLNGSNLYASSTAWNVGIGTIAPSEKLTITGGNIKLYSQQNVADSYRYIGTEYDNGNGNNKAEIRFAIDGSDTKTRLTFHTANGAGTLNEQMRITSAGNVGIGTTTPSAKLDVTKTGVGATTVALALTNLNSSANSGVSLRFAPTVAPTIRYSSIDVTNDGSNQFSMAFITGQGANITEKMRIAPNGYIGINTTAPTQKLHVAGDASFLVGTSSPSQVHDVAAPTQGTDVANRNYVDTNFAPIAIVGSASLWATSSAGTYNVGLGNVGVGTAAPDSSLSVKSAGNAVTNIYGVVATLDYGAIQVSNIGGLTNPSGRPLVLQPNGGKVGIGTTTPGSLLTVGNNLGLTALGTIYNSDSTRWLDMTGAKLDSIKVPGNILTTGGMLVSDLYNAAQIRLNSAGSNFGKIQSDAANTWSLAYSTASSSALGTPALSWNSAGNVGIGTTNPTGKFVIKQSGGNWTDGLNIERSATTDKFNFTHDTAGRLLVGYNSVKALGIFSSGISVGSYAATTPPSDGMIIPGNVGIGTTTPSTKLYVNGVVTATGGFSGPLTGTVNAANISKGIFGANTGQGTYHFGGTTISGDAHFQWNGATYRNPGTYTPQINIRQDNASTGINSFQPALSLYNNNGSLDSTIGLDFVSREAAGAGNAVALAGIMAIKESVGTDNGWTQGGLLFYTKNFGERIDALRILNNGNVGIGTTDPGAFKLKVAGNVAITGTLQTMTGSDFAEEFTVSSPLEAGTVVVMGDLGYKSVKACNEKFDSTVVGVVSDNPSIIAGRVNSKHKVVVAMAGVVKVKVSDANGKIKKGTMLTTSNISGYAMKADNTHPGTIIGKALENLSGQQGEIKVLINLQ